MSVPVALATQIKAKLGVSPRHVNRLIVERANADLVSRRTAAFLIARDNKVSFQKYATPEDLAEMRGVARQPAISAASSPPTPPKMHSAAPKQIKTTKNNSLFVVHGRDTKLNEAMFALLRAFDLNPMEWSEAIAAAKGANPDVGYVINNAMKKVQGVMVMFSPDEQAKLKGKFCSPQEKNTAAKLADQSRPNVIFEAGLALGAHPKKTLLVQVGDTRAISDIAGKHILRLSNSATSRKELAQRLKKLGFKVNTTGTSWLTEGNFSR